MDPAGSDSAARGGAMAEEGSQFPLENASRDSTEHAQTAVLEPKKTEKYLFLKTKPGQLEVDRLICCLDLLINPEKAYEMSDGVSIPRTWQAQLSVRLVIFLWCIYEPYATLGHFIEDTLNDLMANGGLIETLHRIWVKEKLVIRKRRNKNYVSIGGVLDPRFTFHIERDGPPFSGTNYGSQQTADVLLMASKLAYENNAFVKNVVKRYWGMKFVAFYNCWNEYQGRRNTQVFIFTNKPKNATAIVVAFRGTEPFNSMDWATDVEFSWVDMGKEVGEVHLGFLEALGLANRKHKESLVIVRRNLSSRQNMESKDSSLSGLPLDVVLDPSKVLAYDEVTKKVRQLMKKNPKAKLFITGHSLGGALANLYTTFLFLEKDADEFKSRLGALYTFGQPRVGGEKYKQFMMSKVDKEKYWRVVYGNDLVPRVPADDNIFQFKHAGNCYYYNARHKLQVLDDAPNGNCFSLNLKTTLQHRLVALYELQESLLSRWIFPPEFQDNYLFSVVRVVGLFTPGLTAHLVNNYINAVRLGPQILEDTLHGKRRKGLFSFITSMMGWSI